MGGDLKKEIVLVAKTAYLRGLAAGWGGNISVKQDNGTILITPHKQSLGFITDRDILTVDIEGNLVEGEGRPSMELEMHRALYRETESKAVVHLHPPCVNSLVANNIPLQLHTFETRLMLGASIPILEQDSPITTDLDTLVEAFKTASIVFLKHHGVVSAGDDLREAFALADVAEESARLTINSMMVGNKSGSTEEDRASKSGAQALPVFSTEHMALIQKLVNEDEEAQRLGQKYDLTVRYAIKQLDDGRVFNVHFEKGRITAVTRDEDADFINAGKREIWIHVFNGRLDPFAATSQKKLRLQKGYIGDLAKWYAPFYRIFALWKKAPVREFDEE